MERPNKLPPGTNSTYAELARMEELQRLCSDCEEATRGRSDKLAENSGAHGVVIVESHGRRTTISPTWIIDDYERCPTCGHEDQIGTWHCWIRIRTHDGRTTVIRVCDMPKDDAAH